MIDLDAYRARGYAIVDVLAPAEAAALAARIDAILGWGPHRQVADTGFHPSELQHLGDDAGTYGDLAKHYYFHLLTDERFLPVQDVVLHPGLLAAAERVVGAPLVVDNASLFCAEPGTRYELGWHRDVIQIPSAAFDPAKLFTPERFHNNVQINLALAEDEALWVVPGSHVRPDTVEERSAFAGSRHYAPLGAAMPGAVRVRLRPGQAAFYDNDLIHRGHHPAFRSPRRALHLGYHCVDKPPTWHFYLLDEQRFTGSYRARMSPGMRAMVDRFRQCRQRWPRIADTWAAYAPAAGVG